MLFIKTDYNKIRLKQNDVYQGLIVHVPHHITLCVLMMLSHGRVESQRRKQIPMDQVY